MKKLILNLGIACILVFFTSCSSDDEQDSDVDAIKGVWELAAWHLDEGFDINQDGIVSNNLLNEIDCSRNETLLFDDNGVVSLNTTFNPDLDIVLIDQDTNEYSFNVVCDNEGVISLATTYTINDSMIMIGEREALIEGNQISLIYEDRIKIYNNDLTQVVETRDLTLIYTKQ